MKRILALFLAFLPAVLFAQQMTELKKITVSESFTSGESHSYTFNVSSSTNKSKVQLVLRGSDYDYDNDGDFTDFRIQINGTSIIDIEPLKNYSLGANGTFNEITIDITSYVISGNNTIILENTEMEGQVDYTYVTWLQILTPAAGSSSGGGNELQNISVSKSFTSGVEQSYSFYLSNTAAPIKLVVRGSDYDYDNDGDFTDFTIEINGTAIIEIDPLMNHGLGQNGNFNEIEFDISSYVISGNNTVILRNTEMEGQVDYTYITWIKIMGSAGGNVASTTGNELKNISVSKSFTSQTEQSYSFYLSSASGVTPVQLVVRGSDYDYDNDGDFTDFTIEINGTAIVEIDPLMNHGLGKSGTFNEISFDISSYVISGNNTVILRNTEDVGQVDYTYITWIKIMTNTAGSTTTTTTSTLLSTSNIYLNTKFSAYHRFDNSSKRDYVLYLSNTAGLENATLVLDGYDYDYDNDGDFTEFNVFVNSNLISEVALNEKGLGKNGSSAKATFNIGSYLRNGNNTITLENSEISGQTDYAYINSVTVEDGKTSTNVASYTISLNSSYSAYHKFPNQTKKEYKLYLSSISEATNAQLILDGYDYDYDNDADFTEFTISVNGNTVTEYPLKESGLGTNGTSAKATFNIANYLISGYNTITLENTEVAEQVDYTYINTIQVTNGSSGPSVVSKTVTVNTPENINTKFTPLTEMSLSVYIANTSSIGAASLILYGTDMDFDNDNDFTEFSVSVNGTVLLNGTPLEGIGFGKNGTYDYHTFDVGSYLTSGYNTISLKNVEATGQTDYTFMKSVELRTQQGSNAVVNTPPAIEITEPNASRGFQVVQAQTVKVAGRAIDPDGISKVEVNGVAAQVSSTGEFNATIPLGTGNNTIVVVATDNKYMSSTQTFSIENASSGGTTTGGKLKKVALVIGNSAYVNASNLGMNPINDANDMAVALKDLGFDVIKANNADYAQLTQALKEFGSKNTDADVALVFYAGHGIQVDGKNYILPTDVQLKDPRAVALECISVDNVQNIMETSNSSRLNLIILDACRNNPFQTSTRSTGSGLAEMNAPSGTLIAFATSPGKVAANGAGRNGLYTGELLKQIKSSQRLEDVFINTRIEVERISGGQQSPWEVARLKGKYDLTK